VSATARWHEAGFSLIEALLAMAITVTLTASVLTVLAPSQTVAETQPEFTDLQQRLRVGVDLLRHDLLMAGAGPDSGPASGSLVRFFAPILPSRRGASPAYDDGPGAFRPGALSVMYIPSTAPQTTVRTTLTDASRVEIRQDSSCPLGDPACGFRPGTDAVVFDDTGAADMFVVTGADLAGALFTQLAQRGGLTRLYTAGSRIAAIVRHSYFRDASTMQLLRYDGSALASVVLENVVGFDIEYYAEPQAPVLRHPGVDRTVTYGPSPPQPDVVQPPWPAGENCMWQMSAGEPVPRLAALGATGTGLVRLTDTQLTDGPWCPDVLSENRYDADLFRIRKVRVAIRLQTGNPRLRAALGSARSALFANPGTAPNAARTVPDQSIVFDVAPRNMNVDR
jgi:type II secretory pathway pseudopilin PulG